MAACVFSSFLFDARFSFPGVIPRTFGRAAAPAYLIFCVLYRRAEKGGALQRVGKHLVQ